MIKASVSQWLEALEGTALDGFLANVYGADACAAWKGHYSQALNLFAERYGSEGEVVIARCPGQMNLMGMHIDYGGMPSVRIAVRGSDTLTVARVRDDRGVRFASHLEYQGEPVDRFEPFELQLSELLLEFTATFTVLADLEFSGDDLPGELLRLLHRAAQLLQSLL